MRSVLFSVVWTCAWRRARRVLAANPIVAAGVGCAAAAMPLGAAFAGLRLQPRYDDAVAGAAEAFASALALGLGATAAVLGLTVALAAARADALAAQLAAAPASRASLVVGAVIAPIVAVAAVASVPALAFLLALAGRAGVTIFLSAVACALVGAAAGEAVRLLAAGARAGLAVAAGAAAAWTASAAAVGGRAELGPAAALVPAVAGGRSTWPVVVLALVALGAGALWTVACSVPRRDRGAGRELRRDARLPRALGLAVPTAVARAALRHRELRLPCIAAVAAPVAAAFALHVAFGVGGDPLAAFAVGLTLAAAALLPSAAQGLALEARWLIRAAPRPASALRAGAAAGGVALALVLVAATVVGVAPVARADASTLAALESAVALVLGASAFAGAVLPWRPGRIVEQLAAYGVAVAFALVLWAAAGAVADAGTSATSAAVLGNGVLVAGIGAAAVAR